MSTHNICFYGETRWILMSTHNIIFYYGGPEKIILQLSPNILICSAGFLPPRTTILFSKDKKLEICHEVK